MDNILSLLRNILSKGGTPSTPVKPRTTMDQAVQQLQAGGWRDANATPMPQVGQASLGNIAGASTSQPMRPQQQLQQYPQATPISIPQEQLAQNIANTWGKDTPLLKELETYIQAGNKLPGNMEKLLPIALALRETQGGKDLVNPSRNSKLGKNNPYNIRNNTGAFHSYPDSRTASLGNLDQGGESSGLVGLLSGSEPSNRGYYEDFRRTNNYKDLFKRWSPTADNNGAPEEQVANIEWILNQIRQGHQ